MESLDATLVRTRAMTRAEYHASRQFAHRLECEAALLRRDMPRMAASDIARANRLRLDISAPHDATEAKRERRWLRLRAALNHAQRAVACRRMARLIARQVRA